jgi:isopentenyl diphosphate isomerase/L-lactate dehydrogenase-like FMN-dependent dehydrogenase
MKGGVFMTDKIIKAIGLGATVVGLGATVVNNIIAEKKLNAAIEKKVAEALTKIKE